MVSLPKDTRPPAGQEVKTCNEWLLPSAEEVHGAPPVSCPWSGFVATQKTTHSSSEALRAGSLRTLWRALGSMGGVLIGTLIGQGGRPYIDRTACITRNLHAPSGYRVGRCPIRPARDHGFSTARQPFRRPRSQDSSPERTGWFAKIGRAVAIQGPTPSGMMAVSQASAFLITIPLTSVSRWSRPPWK